MDRFVIVFAASITAATILSAVVSGIVVFCVYRNFLRRQAARTTNEEIRMRALRSGSERRLNIVHPNQFPDDDDQPPQPQLPGQDYELAAQRTQAFVDEIERRRRDNETIESDPLNIDRQEREYEEIPDRSNEVGLAE